MPPARLMVQDFVQLRTARVPRAGTNLGSQQAGGVVIMGAVFIEIPAWLLVVSLAAIPQQPAPESQATGSGPGAQPTGEARVDLPVSLSKIKKGISRPAAIKTEETRPVFRVEVIAKRPSIIDILGPDYLIGPVPYGGMTHQEFLDMVTPVEYRGYSAFTNAEGMTVAATSLALKWALMKAVDKLQDARTERAKEAARKEVMDALNRLEEARKKAGLPPK